MLLEMHGRKPTDKDIRFAGTDEMRCTTFCALQFELFHKLPEVVIAAAHMLSNHSSDKQ